MFIQSWRWFGPDDSITLKEIIQTGASSVVSALHQIPVGEVWSNNDILTRKNIIEKSGLSWGVVESVPVHEDIKKRSASYQKYIEAYKQTLHHLGQAGVQTVCYNFMPVLDWSRTSLSRTHNDGSISSGFNYTQFAAIDLFILKRPGAEESYSEAVYRKAEMLFSQLDSKGRNKLKQTFLLGFPGSGEKFSLKEVLHRIEGYSDISKLDFQANLKMFLQEIVPVAESNGIRLAIHPDDPPWPLLGLPRAVSTIDDAEEIIQAVDSPSNGITFCTGSFGAAHTNELPSMAKRLAHRINFLHIRNVSRNDQLNFHEESLFTGDINVTRIIEIMIREDMRRTKQVPGYSGMPVRPDHGAQILGDVDRTYYPGYTLYGRMKNLAEIRGLEMGIRSIIQNM